MLYFSGIFHWESMVLANDNPVFHGVMLIVRSASSDDRVSSGLHLIALTNCLKFWYWSTSDRCVSYLHRVLENLPFDRVSTVVI